MLRGCWIAIVALGLTALPLEIQTQPHEDASQRDQGEDQPITQADVPPINVIDDHSAANAADTPEYRAEQREIDDLAAQQGMNEATQRMADLAEYQTWLTALGTLLLFVTLWLTRQANKAAISASNASADAVSVATAALAHQYKMMKIQMRAYTSFSDFKATITQTQTTIARSVMVEVRNTGSSPTVNTLLRVGLNIHFKGGGRSEDFNLVSDLYSFAPTEIRPVMFPFVLEKAERKVSEIESIAAVVQIAGNDVFGSYFEGLAKIRFTSKDQFTTAAGGTVLEFKAPAYKDDED